MHYARRSAGFIAVGVAVLGATACEHGSAVTDPLSKTVPSLIVPRALGMLASVPVSTPYPAVGQVGRVMVCKNSASPAGAYIFAITASPTDPGDQVASNVTLSPGQCAIIFNRVNPVSLFTTVNITEQIPPGATFRINHVAKNDIDGDASGPGPTMSVKVNQYHSAVVEYFNELIPLGGLPAETPYPGSPSPGRATICKAASSPTGTYNFTVSATGVLPGDQVATTATLQPGHCALVYIRGSSNSAITNITATEVIPANATFTLNHIAVNDPDGPRNTAGPGTTLKVNSSHGAIWTYFNETTAHWVTVCKAGQVAGTFNFTTVATGTIPGDTLLSSVSLASGACTVVFARMIPGVGSASISITETVNANTLLSGVTVNGSAAVVVGSTVVVTQGSDANKVVVFTNIDATVAVPLVPLGAAGTFGILAATTVTCVTGSSVGGDIGNSPGTALTGFGPCTLSGAKHLADPISAQAQLDLTVAYNALKGMACSASNLITADLGGTTKAAGVYCSPTAIGLTGTLTLDGGGDSNAKFVFQAGSTFITAGNIVLINGAQAKNVYFQVGSSATLGNSSVIQGNILALTSITLNNNVTLNGRALARNGAVTLGTNDVITLP